MPALPALSEPVFAVAQERLVPVSDHLRNLASIPPSRMFLINKSLKTYTQRNAGRETFDASQGDGGASLSGAPPEVLERAARLQIDHGTAYDMPYGSDDYRKSVVEAYWELDPALGIGPANVIGTVGGRDGLVKAYQAMLALGHGRQGDVLIVSRVPWISYNWGPYGVGANVLWAPGNPEAGWAYTEDGLRACVDFAARSGRRVAGLVITCPDNPTGLTIAPSRQAELARAALQAGVQRIGGWIDAMRMLVPEPAKLYTWWSYRSPDWAAADKGRRLDHIWVAPALADRVASLKVSRESRGWPRPSDHVPVTATLDVD